MKSTAGAILSAIFLMSVLITSLHAIAVSKMFYEYEHEKNGIYAAIGREEAEAVTGEVIEYLEGASGRLYYETEGKNIFSERETVHMADVKSLFIFFLEMRNWMAIAFAALALALIHDFKVVSRLFSRWMIIQMAVFSVLASAASLKFDYFFTIFHQVFFENDYWLLDPSDSIIINIMPVGFFKDAAILAFLSTMAICSVAAFAACRLGKNKMDKHNLTNRFF